MKFPSEAKINYCKFPDYISMITIAKVKRALIVFTTPFSKNHEEIFHQWIDKISDNSLFYVIYQDFNLNTNYNQVITIKNVAKAAINKISLNDYGYIVENYNLQGMHLYR